ncbi:MAG: hypothetical protein R3F11_27135 [Verrucomicrobiales bacterium]
MIRAHKTLGEVLPHDLFHSGGLTVSAADQILLWNGDGYDTYVLDSHCGLPLLGPPGRRDLRQPERHRHPAGRGRLRPPQGHHGQHLGAARRSGARE